MPERGGREYVADTQMQRENADDVRQEGDDHGHPAGTGCAYYPEQSGIIRARIL